MSSSPEGDDFGDEASSQQNSKKRRVERACDLCRRKKIRCDGSQVEGTPCSTCAEVDMKCTYKEAAQKRAPSKAYVHRLEDRVGRMQDLLHRFLPDVDINEQLGETLHYTPKDKQDSFKCSSEADLTTTMIRRSGDPIDLNALDQDEDTAHLTLLESFRQLSLDSEIDSQEHRFFGKSSGAMLIKAAIDLKTNTSPKEEDPKPFLHFRRKEFWTPRPWEAIAHEETPPVYRFPPDDLMWELVSLYFENVNLFLPLLHRPTFERSIQEELHLKDHSFGAVVLLVCALGSRWSHDPRVFLEPGQTHSAGWTWFNQVQLIRRSVLQAPSLYDLQFYCLITEYLHGTSSLHSCWTMIGIGIRLAQDVGAHRRKVKNKPMTVEDELWKRAFWVMVCIDREMSAGMGRPCAIQEEDFDLDLPIDCDDEYWEHPDPAQAFRQPPGKPSHISFFVRMLGLVHIMFLTLRTIYSLNKSKLHLGFIGPQWEQHIVTELDSALNRWADAVPDHLRWDPQREDEHFFHQSVMLYCTYYQVQILIHRTFIPSPNKPSPLAFPSLAICANAARSCSHIVDIQRKRYPRPMPFHELAVVTSAIILLFNIWSGKRTGLSTNPNKEMADVHKCMAVLKLSEDRWHSAGLVGDILAELASVGDLPLPNARKSNKRAWDDVSDQPSSPPKPATKTVSNTRRVDSATPTSPPDTVFSLPMHSDQLGRMPIHGQVNFSSRPPSPPLPTMDYWGSETHTERNSVMTLETIASDLSASFLSSPDYFLYGSQTQSPKSLTNEQAPRHGNGHVLPAYDRGHTSSVSSSSSNNHPPGHTPPSSFSFDSGSSTDVFEGMIDNDMMTMWSTAPAGFESLDQWNTYLKEISQMVHGTDGATAEGFP